MKQYKEQLTGTGMVYRFTLQQFLKNKMNIISLIIIVIFMMASVPLSSLINGAAGKEKPSHIRHVYFEECTEPFVLTAADLTDAAKDVVLWKNTQFLKADNSAAVPDQFDAYAAIRFNAETGMFDLTVNVSKDTELKNSEIDSLTAFLSEQFDQARYRMLEVTPEQLAFVMSPWEAHSEKLSSYLEDDSRWSTQYWLELLYSIIVMMVSTLSVSYIVRSVIEEKSSKLIELLMVSVKPLALIVGKILASMTYVLITIGCMIGGYLVSYFVCGQFMTVQSLTTTMGSLPLEFSESLLNLNVFALFALIFSLLLAFLTFSIISGVSATGCSSMDDSNGAMTGSMFLIMAGYMVALLTTSSNSPVVAHITGLCPIISVYSAPVLYIMGRIGIGILLLSWVLQIAVIALLAVFSARIYTGLLMHRGNRVKFTEMLSMVKTSSAKNTSKEVV